MCQVWLKLVLKKKILKYFQYNFTVMDRQWTTGEQKRSLEVFRSGELKNNKDITLCLSILNIP